MNDDKLLEQLKKSADNIEVPDSLKPENIKPLLKGMETQQKKNSLRSRLYKICGAAAAVLILVGGIGIYAHNGIHNDIASPDNPSEATTSSADMEANAEDTASYSVKDFEGIESVESYDALYASLEKIQNQYTTYDMGDYATDEAVAEDAAVEENTMESATADAAVAESSTGSVSRSVASDGSNDYSETNLRTQGVDEGDVVKTDGSYIYVLDYDKGVTIVKADSLEKVSEIALADGEDSLIDMYLDTNTLHLISQKTESSLVGDGSTDQAYQLNTSPTTILYTYDISNPAAPALSGQISQSGYYETSRKADGYLYLFTSYYPVLPKTADNPADYVPYINDELMPEARIYMPTLADDTNYLVISSVSAAAPDQVIDSISIVAGTQLFYVSGKHIFIANTNYSNDGEITELLSFAYEKGTLTATAGGSVDGYLNDSFSLDEYDGYLRMVTTRWDNKTQQDVNSLYVLDGELKTVGQIENLAPGETIQSARFMGEDGYFVTFENTDPLFSVDLSNPRKPKIIGKLKIPGFSEYLHPYGNDLLLGIGWDADENTGATSGLKLSMFDISDPSNVKEVDKMIISNVVDCPATYNYKSVMIDVGKNLFGLAYTTYTNDDYSRMNYAYSLFTYDKENGFQNVFTENLQTGADTDYYPSMETTRGLYIGTNFYLYCDNTLRRYDMSGKYSLTGKLSW